MEDRNERRQGRYGRTLSPTPLNRLQVGTAMRVPMMVEGISAPLCVDLARLVGPSIYVLARDSLRSVFPCMSASFLLL